LSTVTRSVSENVETRGGTRCHGRPSTGTPMDEQAPGSTAAAGPIRAVRGTEQVQGPLGARPGRLGIAKREGWTLRVKAAKPVGS
jgi:hypothetical protein